MPHRQWLSVLVAMFCAGAVQADWNPGDPYKMHYPQMPDPQGWDVNMTFPKVLADDWRCTETGPVTDIHFWFSIEQDRTDVLAALLAAGSVHASIHADVPADPTNPFSHPGQLLWSREFSPGAFTIRPYGQGPQGWYDPNTGEARRPDHFQYFQANIENIFDPFHQDLGTIYWLDLSIVLPPGVSGRVGWKTSLDHFNDDAVWTDSGLPDWHELRDPFTQESLDMAFVITPEPASAALLLGGLIMVLRTRRAA
ncbi:MAG: hypothetical protein HZB38_10800 [Planctomycetes bacterium]|nr:hypothetical protein [Planctomycetota bacterium]